MKNFNKYFIVKLKESVLSQWLGVAKQLTIDNLLVINNDYR